MTKVYCLALVAFILSFKNCWNLHTPVLLEDSHSLQLDLNTNQLRVLAKNVTNEQEWDVLKILIYVKKSEAVYNDASNQASSSSETKIDQTPLSRGSVCLKYGEWNCSFSDYQKMIEKGDVKEEPFVLMTTDVLKQYKWFKMSIFLYSKETERSSVLADLYVTFDELKNLKQKNENAKDGSESSHSQEVEFVDPGLVWTAKVSMELLDSEKNVSKTDSG